MKPKDLTLLFSVLLVSGSLVNAQHWVEAGYIRPGMKLINSIGKTVDIINTESLTIEEKVYNIEVEKWHSYYVSNQKILCHNYEFNKKGEMTSATDNNQVMCTNGDELDIAGVKEFVGITVGESTNNVEEATGIGGVLLNRLEVKGGKVSGGFADKIGGKREFLAIGEPQYNSITSSSLKAIFSPKNRYSLRVKGAMAALCGAEDASKGALFWGAKSGSWAGSQVRKGVFERTTTIGGTSFFRYRNVNKTWP